MTGASVREKGGALAGAQPQPRNIVVTKANAIIEASYRLTLQEQRLVLFCIAHIDSRKPLEEQRCFTIEAGPFRDVFGLAQEKVYEELKDAGNRLFEREIFIDDVKNNQITRLRWVSKIRYHKSKGRLEVNFAPELLPFISSLRERFTSYPLSAVAALSTTYAIRLFEILTQYKTLGRRALAVEQLRRWLDCTECFERFSDFDRWVLKPSIEQINARTPLQVAVERIKSGRHVVTLEFTIARRELPTAATTEAPALADAATVAPAVSMPTVDERTPAMKLVAHFYQLQQGLPVAADTLLPRRDVQFADKLLLNLDAATVKAFIEFAFAQAQQTRFQVQTLRGLEQYLPAFSASRTQHQQRDAQSIRQAQDKLEEQARRDYRADMRNRVAGHLAALDPAAREEVRRLAAAQIEATHPAGSLFHHTLLGVAESKVAEAQLDVPAFETWFSQWQQGRRGG